MNPWETIKQQLETAVSPQSFRDWINRTSFGQLDGGVLSVHVPNRETKTWLETEFCSHVDSIIRRLQVPVQSVLYQLAAATGESAVVMQSDQEFGLESPFSQLNPKFTFDSFVVGACNQFAHAAAVAALVSSLLVCAAAPLVGQAFSIRESLVHALLAIAGIVSFYGVLVFLSTTVGELHKAVLGAALLFLYGMLTFLANGFRQFSMLRLMTGDMYFLRGEIPWAGICGSVGVALVMVWLSLMIIERRDYSHGLCRAHGLGLVSGNCRLCGRQPRDRNAVG